MGAEVVGGEGNVGGTKAKDNTTGATFKIMTWLILIVTSLAATCTLGLCTK